MTFRWFYSKTVREACAMRKHVERLLCAQRDILAPAALGAVTLALNQLRDTVAAGENIGKIRLKMDELDFAANKWLKPYPNAMWRENVEVLLVAIAVAMAIRTLFLQPFKIPTGSMQPTLYGVTSMPDLSRINIGSEDRARIQAQISEQIQQRNKMNIPTGWQRIKEWFEGISYLHVVAEADGELQAIEPPVHFLIFNIKQTLVIGGHAQTIWFPPDYGEEPLEARAGYGLRLEGQRVNLFEGHVFHLGDDVIKMKVSAGDHLFVDRLSYNFRKPQRGEIVVFATAGIAEDRRESWRIPGDQFYIKRLVGLGGETLSLSQDHEVAGAPQPQFGGDAVPVGHLVVNGQPLSASTPHFENLYSYSGAPPGVKTLRYQDNHYYGHAMIYGLSPGREFQVATNHLYVMGDNTMNSLDSRFWGDFPVASSIGKSFFVYWPITRRFGWGNQ
ncbi:MAG: S26 family signal peptidase [Limisphaerales bacterium]